MTSRARLGLVQILNIHAYCDLEVILLRLSGCVMKRDAVRYRTVHAVLQSTTVIL